MNRCAAKGRFYMIPLVFMLALISPSAHAQLDILGAIEDPYPLRAADTSSPRDTLRSFLRDINAGYEAWRSEKPRADVYRPMLRAGETLDLTPLPSLRRDASMVVRSALLKEVLDRVQLPPFDQIPGDEEVANEGITRWVVPNTKIEVVKIEEGPKAGQFLFSAETVRNVKSYYDTAKSLPYTRGAIINLYQRLLTSPGAWVPTTFVDGLPAWSTEIVFGQGVWQWIGLLILVVVAGTTITLFYRLGVSWDKKQQKRSPWLRFGMPLALLLSVIIAEFVYKLSLSVIGLLEGPLNIVSYSVLVVQVGSLAWFVLLIAGRLAEAFAGRGDKSEMKKRADAALMRILFRLASVIILAYLGIYAAEAVGIPIAPLVAGLGVGGLAIALAVRPTLENIIGGLTLFADRPVRVGDFCRYGDQIGTVEQIGLRSTRIRSLERSLVTIPNSEFSQMQLDNFAARDLRLLKTVLQLRYETTPDQLRYVLAELRKMLLGHPMVTPDPGRVRFVAYGAYSLDLEVFAYLRCQDQDAFLAIQEDILLRMADIVKESGTGFAFPSQTMYFTRDSGVDAERGHEAEAAVEEWRQRDRLPFPEFDPGLRWEMEDILDYPQKGSHDYQYRKGLSEGPAPERQAAHSPPAAKPKAPPSVAPAAAPSAEPKPKNRWLRFLGKRP